MSNYQDRVVEEKTSLDEKIKKLASFAKTEPYEALTGFERVKLRQQLDIMLQYSNVLNERIISFPVL
ncbi:hypothetical protein KAR91_02060 [Candidatus Pacearchaeota archaeon]|nr:hypothetical protein [Candidatus Pacearchaeota archaeon]